MRTYLVHKQIYYIILTVCLCRTSSNWFNGYRLASYSWVGLPTASISKLLTAFK